MKKIKENSHSVVFKVFFILGLLLLTISIGLFINNRVKKANSVPVQATITDIVNHTDSDGDVSHTVYVEYEYNDRLYEDIRIKDYKSSMRIGDKITIYILKDNPTEVVSKSDFISLIIIIPIGLVFTLLGGGMTIRLMLKTKKQKKIKKTGDKIKCYISDISPDTSYTVNGRFVNSILTCQPVEKSNIAEYKSNSYTNSNLLQVNNIIYVYVDKENPENYYVDLNSGTGEDANISNSSQEKQDSYETNICDYCGTVVSGDNTNCPNCKASLKK